MQNTYNHSVKVPKLYKCAAKISQEVAGGSASIKQLVYEKTHFNTKALYALVVTTFQKAKEIDLLLKRTKLLEKEPRLNPWLAKILISEVLWGKKQLPKSDAKPIQTILAYEQAFHAHLSDSSEDLTAGKGTSSPKKPRYVRINTLFNPFNEALELFQDEGWTLQTLNRLNDYKSFLEQVFNLEGDFMLKDMHVPELLIFPGGTEFYNHPGYKKGALVLQDKASCLPAYLLSPPPGSVVLDMCAAPGMKTTQLATMLQNEGTIYAVERDQRRFDVLNKMVECSGATCIRTFNKDVLQCGDSDFPDVEYILVDPSCSASGMTDRLELQQNRDQLRLQKLAGFQIKILRSALTRYPKAKKVVYSTCSLYPEENEDVVRQVLETNNQFKLIPADQVINKAWKNYGSSDFGDIGKYCLYARPEEDLTNGFFVAVFERLKGDDNNQFFNGRVMNYRKKIEQKQARKERKYKEKYDDNFKTNEETNEEAKELRDISEDYVETDGSIYKEVGDDNIHENLKMKKKHKKSTHVDRPNKNLKIGNVEELPKKQNKTRQHGEAGSDTHAAEDDEKLYNMDAAEGIKEPFKKCKKTKRKDNEECENDIQTYENDIPIVGPNQIKVSEGKYLSKSKQKKRRHFDVENIEQLNNEIEGSTLDCEAADKNKDLLKKGNKKKKKKHSDVADAIQSAMSDVLIAENILKNGKKRKVKEGADINLNEKMEHVNDQLKEGLENINEDAANVLNNESLSKRRRKKEKQVYAERKEKHR